MELAVLGARVDFGRHAAHEIAVEVATGEISGQLLRVDADDAGAEATIQHFGNQFARVAPPEREHRFESSAAQAIFAVAANVFEEEIAESDGRNSFCNS